MKKTILLLVAVIALVGCGAGRVPLHILSGSENETLEPLLSEFSRAHGIDVQMSYKGSVDIMLELQKGAADYDAVWPANSLWISLGDSGRRVKLAQSIMTSPVVFGIRMEKAKELGFVGKEVHVRDILAAIRQKKLSFAMTSASQSNSGASAYLGFLHALLGDPDVITISDLSRPELKQSVRELLGGINRSSGSSGWLKELFLASNYDAMVNYEALVIEANQELVKTSREPLYVVYPVDGIVMADSPLGYVDHGQKRKEEAFRTLQAFLLSEGAQKRISARGRRTGIGGVAAGLDPSVFNPAWGIDTARILSPVKLPAADVILQALTLYQTEYRKPSLTVYCLDFSGSMASNDGARQLKSAMGLLLDQTKAQAYLLQTGQDDVVSVIPFNDRPLAPWEQDGNDTAGMEALLTRVTELQPGGSTDIYTPVLRGLDFIARFPHADRFIPAIVLMTDGRSNTGATFADLKSAFTAAGLDVPVFCVMFGDASKEQLQEIADLTRGRVFDGRKDLVTAFRAVRGYN
ncbi:MAG TPA: VWA domain-containing protein [Spirochaetia bacterium]|nr:VWA domain-containing protein [Spirochaetia bacterium]